MHSRAMHDSSAADSSGEDSDGANQDEGNYAAGKQYPLAHSRCISMASFRNCEILESLLDRSREVTLLSQFEGHGFGEGLDLGIAYILIGGMRDELKADRVEIISGRGESETWKEVNANGLPKMFKLFRSIMVSQLTQRFKLDTTPDKHTLLAMKMHPAQSIHQWIAHN